MTFTFVHTADWQLGRPFRAFEARIAGVLEEARFAAIDRIAVAARGAGAGHVLVAGDVFDATGLPAAVLLKAMERLRKHGDVRWHLLPGNHDHVRAGGIWQRLIALGLPDNVALHLEAKVSEIAVGVALLPAPLAARAESADPTGWMDGAATAAGTLRIGLAHGSIRDFGADGETSAIRIDPTRARRAGLAYLALGDWHGKLMIEPRSWYSGTPEPDRYTDNDPGYALVVHVDGAEAPPRVEPVRTGCYVWAREAHVLVTAGDIAAIEQRLEARGTDFDRMVVRLVLGGSLPLADHARLAAWQERLAARVLALDTAANAVGVAAAAGDLEAFARSSEVLAAARFLQSIAADPDDTRSVLAGGALARMAAMLASEGEASP